MQARNVIRTILIAALAAISVTLGQTRSDQLSITPASMSISAGSDATLTVTVNRTAGLSGAVTVSLVNLPSGLRADPLTIPANASDGKLNLRSDATALTGGPVRVTVRGVSGTQSAQAVVRFTMIPPGTQATWLDRLNQHRTLANLPAVTDEPAWSDGCYEHTRYMIKNQEGEHSQNKTNPWFSQSGLECAQNANLSLSSSLTDTDQDAVDGLMTIPFHGIGMIDPALSRSAFASYREDGKNLRMAAALDVIRGRGDVPASVKYPVIWPGDGKTVPFARFGGGEWPDPLSSCRGYKAPAGLPVLFLASPGKAAPKVTGTRFSSGTQVLDHCVFTQATYKNPRSDELELARSILGNRRAVVLIPKVPLTRGTMYTVSMTVDGQAFRWSFTVSSSAN